MRTNVGIRIAWGGYELSSARIDHLGRAYRRLDRSGRLLRVIDLGSIDIARIFNRCRLGSQDRRFAYLRCNLVASGLVQCLLARCLGEL